MVHYGHVTDNQSAEDNSPRVTLIVMDRKTGETQFFRSDGKVATFPNAPSMDQGSRIAKLYYLISSGKLAFETTRGDMVEAILPRLKNSAPIDGRPVIYLDQNHWSTLMKATYDPKRVRDMELGAARELIAMAEAREIILPMSAGHLNETGHWSDDEARYRLALTLLRLSGGWQMRDPLGIRDSEVQNAVRRHIGKTEFQIDAITLEPWAIHDSDQRGVKKDDPAQRGFPPEYEFSYQAMVAASVYFDVALDGDAIPIDPPGGWRATQQQYTDQLHSLDKPKAQKRKVANAFFMSDASKEIATAAAKNGISNEEFAVWLNRSLPADVAAMPAMGMFREIYVDRHLNKATTWAQNDLADFFYLSCAAGYADHVVAERYTGSLLRAGQRRLGRPATVSVSFVELMRKLAPSTGNVGNKKMPRDEESTGHLRET
jgi:hypothetical protein